MLMIRDHPHIKVKDNMFEKHLRDLSIKFKMYVQTKDKDSKDE